MSPLAHGILTGAAVLAVVVFLPTLVRKPAGLTGKWSLKLMNLRHAGVTDWGLSHVTIAPSFAILDVGCGGGRTIAKLAAMASAGRVYGVDISAQSVALSRETNAREIAAGRVDIQQAPVSRLPFADGMFDLVTAVETHYYWPDPVADMREVRRVLKPGGRLLLIAETYKAGGAAVLLQPVMKMIGARFLTIEEHRSLFADAGFQDIVIDADPGRNWIAGVGVNPVG